MVTVLILPTNYAEIVLLGVFNVQVFKLVYSVQIRKY
jgi:hypothetical protein